MVVGDARGGGGDGRAGDPGRPAVGPEASPTLTRPGDPVRPVWKVDFAGGVAADWTIKVEVRQPRPKTGDARRNAPYPVGPFAALGVFRQTGSVEVTAGPHTRFSFRHGPSLRQVEPGGPADGDDTTAHFRLATGPVPNVHQPASLLEVEVRQLTGKLLVRPTYALRLTDGGWRVRAEVHVVPVRSEVDQVVVELPAGWPVPDASPARLVDGVQLQKSDGPRLTLVVRLAAVQREPFDFTLSATLPVADAARGTAAILLPRFPQSQEGDTQVTVLVPAGTEVSASAHEWEGEQVSGRSHPMAPAAGADGKPLKPVTAVAGRLDQGAARIDVVWQPHRPDLAADLRVDVEVQDLQILVDEEVRLQSPDGFSRPVVFRGPAAATGLLLVASRRF